jgi:hypothetical protein
MKPIGVSLDAKGGLSGKTGQLFGIQNIHCLLFYCSKVSLSTYSNCFEEDLNA